MLSRLTSSSTCKRAVCAVVLTLASVCLVAASGAQQVPTVATVNHRATAYEVSAGLDGEIFPVFANYASLRRVRERQWGTIAVRVSNPGPDALRNRITVQVPGWSDAEIQIGEVDGGDSHTFLFAPTFLPRLYQNREIVAATAVVTVADLNGAVVHEETVPIRLRSVDDLYWGRDFEYAPFIASWVTPHDPSVEQVLARAKEFAVSRRLPGYGSNNEVAQERSTLMQARAIYRAVREQGVSYVKSSMTLGRHEEVSERVRMPGESLEEASANCIDGAVLYSALFENLGMDPAIVLVPGHAYVAVRIAPGSKKFLYIETSLTGRADFDLAVASARRSLAKFTNAQVTRVNIRQARLDGIYPMPASNPVRHDRVLEAGNKSRHPRS